MSVREIIAKLASCGDPEKAAHHQRYFKTGPGEYGEGDRFYGIRVPILRKLARQYKAISLAEVQKLLHSEYHEARLLAVLILTLQYQKAEPAARQAIFELYITNTRWINNWDLVDTSAHLIVGPHLENGDRNLLKTLARSSLLWDRRIAIMSTFFYIRKGHFVDTLKIAEQLRDDSEDLIHKAVGWMLREIGNRDQEVEEQFLRQHYQKMPRVMLRYAIEKFTPELRQDYLKGRITENRSTQ